MDTGKQKTENIVHDCVSHRLWQKASIAGGLWASVEIIVGSFLHNLRLPFAGAFLASFGVLTMIVFFRVWPCKGLIWRAGLIGALMKSISPSAIIFGPMIGIMSEALVLEMMLRLFGANLLAVLIGGAMAVSTALVQKLFNILIIYGSDLVQVYINLVDYAARQLGYNQADPWLLIIILFAWYAGMGIVAAVTGFYLGKQASFENRPAHYNLNLGVGTNSLFSGSDRKYSVLWLVFHLFMIPAGILAIKNLPVLYSSMLLAGYLGTGFYLYPRLMTRISKPLLLIQLILVIVLSGLFYEKADSGTIFSLQGISVGYEMALRALLIIGAFTAISVELRNPLIQRFLSGKGLDQLYGSLSNAFRILPYLIETAGTPRNFFKHPIRSVSGLLSKALELEASIRNDGTSITDDDRAS